MVAALLLLAGVAGGQENGASTRTSGAKAAQGPESRPPSSRPATDLERALADVRRAPTISAATLTAGAAYSLGGEARKALIDMCREKTLPDAVFEGIVGFFEFQRDQTIVPTLIDLYGTALASRERYLTERFRVSDSQRSMLETLFADLEKGRDDARRRTLLRVLAEVVDTAVERHQASRFLVQAFQRAEFHGLADDVSLTLQKITFHDYTQAARWQKWFDEFSAVHREGFAEADLYRSALRERDLRFVAEVKRSINVALANKQIPDYFNIAQYPEPSIRVHAAQEFVALKEAGPEILGQAVEVLIGALKNEKNDDVTCAILKTLGAMAENKDDLKEKIAPQLVGFLKDERDAVVVAALMAIAQTGNGLDCHVVEDLYVQPGPQRVDRASVRAQVVTTLYSLDCGSPTIVTALQDGSPDVRASAARGLGYGKQTDAAPKIARALKIEKNEEVQRVMVRALISIQSWPAEVVDAVAEIAARTGAARDAAVRGLIQAASVGPMDSDRANRIVAILGEAIPAIASVPDRRRPLLDEFQNARGDVAARIVLAWLEKESHGETAKDLAAILARVAPRDADVLQDLAAQLVASDRAAAAVVLLRAAVAQTNAGGSATAPAARPDLKLALAEALLKERTSDGLNEAEGIASQELRVKPEDGQLLLLRGSIREALGRRFEAAEDLRHALRTEGVVMADPQRQEAERKTALLLLTEDPEKAQEFLDTLPPGPRDRDFMLVQGKVAIAVGEPRKAILHLRAALKSPGKEDVNIIRYHLARALIASPRADDRLEAKTLLAALEGEPPMTDGHPLMPLREDLRAEDAARNAVRELDNATPESAPAALGSVVAAGDRALSWLFHQLPDLARSSPPAVIDRRMTAVETILASSGTATRPAALATPPPEAPRDSWVEFAARATAWYAARR